MPQQGEQISTILIVDDEPDARKTLEGVLRSQGYRLEFACNGMEAIERAVELVPNLILLDVMMPGLDGFEVCQRLRAHSLLAEVPIILITALDDRDSRVQGIEAGADDFISKPFDRTELRVRVRTITRLNRYHRLLDERTKFERMVELSPDSIMLVDRAGIIQLVNAALLTLLGVESADQLLGQSLWNYVNTEGCCRDELKKIVGNIGPVERGETVFVRVDGQQVPVELTIGALPWNGDLITQIIAHDITKRKQAEEEIRRSHAALAQAYDETLEGWARALELRDYETRGHSQRVTELTERLARRLGIGEEELVQIRRGALLHDIGKMGIPDSVLLKPGKLDEDEWVLIRRHPTYAYEMLLPISFLHDALDIPYAHHEKWDGSGYPRGLRGEEIPLAARIFALVDVWDALRSERPYHKAWPVERAREQIEAGVGSHFDPTIASIFLAMIDEELNL